MPCPSSTKELLDIATKLALSAKNHNVKSVQVRMFLDLIENLGRSNDALLVIMAHALRQSGRNVINQEFAAELLGEFKKIYNECGGGAGNVAHNILKYMNWIYDGIENLQLSSDRVYGFMDLVNIVTSPGRLNRRGSRQ